MSAFAVASDQNAPHKKANQDAAISAIFRNKAGVAIRLVAVADGISNSYRGELAAKHTILTLGRMLEGSVLKNARELADIAEQKVVREINRQLLEINDGTVCSKTTLTAVVIFPEDNCIIHLGDTRAFAVGKKGKYCISLTEDHNPAQGKDRQMQRAGIHRFLGDEWDAWKPDVIFNHKDIDDDTSLIFVTCDGVHDFLNEDLLLGMLNQCNGDVSLFCKRAVAQAKVMWSPKGKANGDNITMAALDLHSDEDEKIPTAVFGGAAEGESPSNPASEKARLTEEIASKTPDSGARKKAASKTSNPKKSGRPAWWWPTLIGFNALIVLTMVFLVVFLGGKKDSGVPENKGSGSQEFHLSLDDSINKHTVRIAVPGQEPKKLSDGQKLMIPTVIAKGGSSETIIAELLAVDGSISDERKLVVTLDTANKEITVLPKGKDPGSQVFDILLDDSIKQYKVRITVKGQDPDDLSNGGELSIPSVIAERLRSESITAEILAADGRVSNKPKLVVKLDKTNKIVVLPAESEVEASNLPELDPEPEGPKDEKFPKSDPWEKIRVNEKDSFEKIARKSLEEIYDGSYREGEVKPMVDLLRQEYKKDYPGLAEQSDDNIPQAGDTIRIPASKEAYLEFIGQK